MSFLQPWMLLALPIVALPVIIHLINQWRYQTKPWGAMNFLLAANRMNRGFARIRQWLILAMRTLAVAGLIFAIARPLSSGLLGLTGAGKSDTTIVIMDRSPSMQQRGVGGRTKLETARSQIENALSKFGSTHWVAIDSTTAESQEFESLEGMMQSSAMQPASAVSDLPRLLQSALEYLRTNNPGPSEIWICSDLRESDWDPDNPTWALLREDFQSLPQAVRFNLLAYPNDSQKNLSVRVTEARRVTELDSGREQNSLLVSLRLEQSGDNPLSQDVPVRMEVDGARSEVTVQLDGRTAELRNHRIPLPREQETGWGRVSIPADANNADNQYFFVYAEEPVRRVVVVSDDRQSTKALEIAASINGNGEAKSIVEVLSASQLDSLALDGCALLLWQTRLPGGELTPILDTYIAAGGQVIFFPPATLQQNAAVESLHSFAGVAWDEWQSETQVMVENWRGDQDLLAATNSGVGLPVGQLEIEGYASLQSNADLVRLGTLTGGVPLLVKVPSDRGGIYFCAASADPRQSTLAESGIVLFVLIQCAIEAGEAALGNSTQRVAGSARDATIDNWTRIVGNSEPQSFQPLSSEFDVHAGVYQAEESLFAINRPMTEDEPVSVSAEKMDALFEGLQYSRVDDSAGNLSGLVREIWRIFLIAMIVALIVEAALCIPRSTGIRAQAFGTQN